MTAWILAIGVVALIGAVAVVATGRGEAMREVTRERRTARVPAHGPLTASDLRRVRFSTAVRGYRADEVDELLARVAEQLDDPDVP